MIRSFIVVEIIKDVVCKRVEVARDSLWYMAGRSHSNRLVPLNKGWLCLCCNRVVESNVDKMKENVEKENVWENGGMGGAGLKMLMVFGDHHWVNEKRVCGKSCGCCEDVVDQEEEEDRQKIKKKKIIRRRRWCQRRKGESRGQGQRGRARDQREVRCPPRTHLPTSSLANPHRSSDTDTDVDDLDDDDDDVLLGGLEGCGRQRDREIQRG